VLIVLWLFPVLELRIDRARETHNYAIVTELTGRARAELKASLTEHDLLLYEEKMGKTGDTLTLQWKVSGSHTSHEEFANSMLVAPGVIGFEY